MMLRGDSKLIFTFVGSFALKLRYSSSCIVRLCACFRALPVNKASSQIVKVIFESSLRQLAINKSPILLAPKGHHVFALVLS